MAKGHAVTGAATWIGGCVAATIAARRGLPAPNPTWYQLFAGAIICAGAALLPDIDHPDSTVTRSLGPISRILSAILAWIAGATRRITCGHCLTLPRVGGHRALTHTALFAIAVGVGIGWLAAAHGKTVATIVVAASAFLASFPALSKAGRAKVGGILLPDRLEHLSFEAVTGRGDGRSKQAIGRRLAAFIGSVVIACVTTLILQAIVGNLDNWWWVGLAVGGGVLIHTLGDLVTKSAVPLLWPLPIRGCSWRSVGPPRWMRITTGGTAEKVITFVFGLAGLGGLAYLLVGTQIAEAFSETTSTGGTP